MSAGKRSAALTATSLVVVALAGCGAASVGVPVALRARIEPVAVLSTPDAWASGVHAVPLAPGDSLLFDFGTPVSPAWTMEGVTYDLELWAVDGAGVVLEGTVMSSCAEECMSNRLPTVSRWWVEHRTD